MDRMYGDTGKITHTVENVGGTLCWTCRMFIPGWRPVEEETS